MVAPPRIHARKAEVRSAAHEAQKLEVSRKARTSNWATFAACVLLSIAVGIYYSPKPPLSRVALLRALHATGNIPASGAAPRIAVGYNANLDLIVDGAALMDAMLGDGAAPQAQDALNGISTKEELLATFAHWFSAGAAAEREIEDAALFDALLTAAKEQEGGRYAVGGNAALIARKAATSGLSVLLGGPVGAVLKSLLPSSISLASPTLAEKEEVHLILEYASGASWRNYTSPRANRFIVTRDEANGRLGGLEDFHAAVADFDATALVLSGFHLLEGLSDAEQKQRVAAVPAALAGQTQPVHVELASLSSASLLRNIADNIFSAVSSLGMNEQELGMAWDTLLADGKQDEQATAAEEGEEEQGIAAQLAAAKPQPQAAVTALLALFERYAAAPDSKLRRLHYHTLAFHVVMQLSASDEQWPSPEAGVAWGSATATLQACNASVGDLHGKQLNVVAPRTFKLGDDEYKLTHEKPVIEHTLQSEALGPIAIYIAPVVVCKDPVGTVGLGDAISASALTAQLR